MATPCSTPRSGDSSHILLRLLQSPFLIGGLAAGGFYAGLPHVPFQADLLQHYFCSHPLSYATTLLFFTAIVTLAQKSLRFSRERRALRRIPKEMEAIPPAAMVELCQAIRNQIAELPRALRSSQLGRRIQDACSFLNGRQSARGLEEHLRYLADLQSERLHQSFALVRTVTWAVPILGFLGTVIGITMAIANVTPEQLDTSLSDVTNGLAVAFDTTALALSLSILLVFVTFVVERGEQQIGVDVEEFAVQQLLSKFPADTASPLQNAERQVADQLQQTMQGMIQQHVSCWTDGLEQMRGAWEQTMTRQRDALQQSLSSGVEHTLQSHTEQLAGLREEFLQTMQATSTTICQDLRQAQESQLEIQRTSQQQFTDLWNRLDQTARQAEQFQSAQAGHLITTLTEQGDRWSDCLEQNSQIAREQLQELRSQADVFLNILTQEQQLLQIQERLTENLEAVRAAETFEETLHNLTAAVHLLVTRVKPKAA